ncbi:MAG: hypothetical protein NZZ41_06720 [Candidatus Dojkabacteria bacterium]|nr:hypothetical protein [Candidatus Dojkabacteria bacterium]
MKGIEVLEQTRIAVNDVYALIRAAKEAKKSEKKEVDLSARARIKTKINSLIEFKAPSVKLSFKDISHSARSIDVKAMSATAGGVTGAANMLCVEKRVPVYIQDVLPMATMDRAARIFNLNTVVNRSTLFSYAPITENAAKPETTTTLGVSSIGRVKLAWYERNSIEAERYHDAGEYIGDYFAVKIAESIHYYILQQLATGAPAIPAGLFPGAGSLPNAVLFDGIYALAQMCNFYFNTDCGSEFHLWVPPADYIAYSIAKKNTLDPILGEDSYSRHLVEDRIAGIKVYPHAVFGGLPAGHSLLGANNILLYDTSSIFVAVDDEVLLFRQEQIEENRIRYVVEMFVAVGRVPQPNALFLGLSAPFVFVTNRTSILNNI